MIRHAADVLLDAIDRTAAPVCVGIDPVIDRLPRASRGGCGAEEAAAAIRSFTLGVLDQVAEHVPCVKFQSACFERHGHHGVRVLAETIAAAQARGLEVILDAKRGDIGISADHYAAACFGASPAERPDWVTINSYLGADGITPFLERGGAFALVRTSNPGGDSLQQQQLASGNTVAEHVASMIAEIGCETVGESGYSSLGAVQEINAAYDVIREHLGWDR